MCCSHRLAEASAPGQLVPNPTEIVVGENLPDGYWLQAFYFHRDDLFPDLVGYGLGTAKEPATIMLYVNPKNQENGATGWLAVPIQIMDFPVAMAAVDLTGDGYNDVVICDRYGPSMGDLWPKDGKDGGRVQWLRNPGRRIMPDNTPWAAARIGNSTGMHRLNGKPGFLAMAMTDTEVVVVGRFTSNEHPQVLAVPIIAASSDLESPAPVILFTPQYSTDVNAGPTSWDESVPFPNQFRLIHDVKVLPVLRPDLDGILVSGREGIVYLYYNRSRGWASTVIGNGLAPQGANPYWGSGSVDIGRVLDDPVGYIATSEVRFPLPPAPLLTPTPQGFHGNVVSVYIKKDGAPKGAKSLLQSSNWTRVKIDDFGPLNAAQHTGTIHHVAVGDFDDSGIDSFAIACMGAPIEEPKNSGVYLYKPTDIKTGTFKKSQITNRSAGRLAVAHYTSKDRPVDIASISYYVPRYHTGPEAPSIRINPSVFFAPDAAAEIRAARLQHEVLLLIPRPKTLGLIGVVSMPLITVAGKRLIVYAVPPDVEVRFGPKDAIKVLYGDIVMKSTNGKVVQRTLAPERFQAATTRILSADGSVRAGADGAVFLLMEHMPDLVQGPFHSMHKLQIGNVFPAHTPADVQALQFGFTKVDQLPWASGGNWDKFEFYNMSGFQLVFGDDAMEKICHVQLWTLGLGETARFHIHDTVPFCEIHCCLSNGGTTTDGYSGMRWFPDDFPFDTAQELQKAYVENNSKHLACRDLEEHGPLWKVQPGGFRARPLLLPNGCVDYPFHGWLSSRFGDRQIPIDPPLVGDEQRYDVWLAFEFPIAAFQF
ncbi:hypothetical protein MIND_01252400 [Mycena indigotica]|uniref:Aldos-2-ulose dehydratase/isomerase (AUDH) Cupin domain-containing protein n=1 Tax=Mycena indigotica TaxID=2126181 RepID=A0A8H6S2Y7_9AGAR|nr:uncharacterized protein MIND_01252400 [Mycena indigotica]KAF7292250.1 hypothetical protein MIND_01252400 [Mycena indigotica]